MTEPLFPADPADDVAADPEDVDQETVAEPASDDDLAEPNDSRIPGVTTP